MRDYLPLLASLVGLLIGLLVGKGWERYKLRDGRWVDRRRLRDTPHYMLGLTALLQGQMDQALDELTHATATDPDALELQMILGNLLREKGQVARAITIHQSLLQRPDLTRLEHAYILLCLGLDFRRAGFVDRAIDAFTQVRTLDPPNVHALVNLQKLYEEQHDWEAAIRMREAIAATAASPSAQPDVIGFLRNEIGLTQQRAGDQAAAARSFTEALELDAAAAPAYLNLGDLREAQGDRQGAIEIWEALTREVPGRAYLVFDRLARAYEALGTPNRFIDRCRDLITEAPTDWRARLALSRRLAARGQHEDALLLLFEALPHNPHGLAIHQEIWQALLATGLDAERVRTYVSRARESIFYLDPHICTRCRYRSTELLWQCPQCHEWNTFVEERIAPARQAVLVELD